MSHVFFHRHPANSYRKKRSEKLNSTSKTVAEGVEFSLTKYGQTTGNEAKKWKTVLQEEGGRARNRGMRGKKGRNKGGGIQQIF